MSILIKGIEMPKDGEWVNVNICSDGSVYFVKSASNGFVFYGVRKGEAIEIPPHGRLIDGDVAEAIYFTDEDANGKDFYDGILYSADFISKQPTIIPAEEGKT